jgi:hypothetical protein
MEYPIYLNEQQVEVLKSIFEQLQPKQLIVPKSKKPKKLSVVEQTLKNMQEYKTNKALRKR